jgi:hypothetical protein
MYDPDGYDIGQLVWQACEVCRRGSINKISINQEWQRRGLGRCLIERALRDGPGFTWITSGQSPAAKEFFPTISAETGTVFTERGRGCTHINGASRPSGGGRDRPPKPILERDLTWAGRPVRLRGRAS